MKPISNYGKNKKEIEIYLNQMGKKNNLKSYHLDILMQQVQMRVENWRRSHPETHLIPKILKSINKIKIKYMCMETIIKLKMEHV